MVSRRGSIDWCCFPKFDSPSYFARLLDPNGGHFSVTPVGHFESRQNYLEHTNIVRTEFVTTTGSATLTDFISVKGPHAHPDELWPDEEILRIIEGQAGQVELKLELFPRAQYGRKKLDLRWIGDWGIKASDGRKHFLFQATLARPILGLRDSSVQATFKIRAGDRVVVSLTYSDEAPTVMPPLATAADRFEHTVQYWKHWSKQNQYSGPHESIIERSALALKLLNFAPSGAFVAAPTCSLPEWFGGARNWDYRFCWLRDASFTTRALVRLGYIAEAKSFLNWLVHSTRLTWPRLQVLYTVYGESTVKERFANWLAGFRKSKPVRIGNHASTQVQLDVYGEVIDSFYALSEFLHPIDHETRKMLVEFGSAVAELWRKPDHGIWEFRRTPRHYTHSKVMCWVAMDRLARLAKRYEWTLPYDAAKVAQDIRNEVEAKGFDPSLGYYTRAFGEGELDASLLVMPLVGFCPADAPRFRATRDAIIQHLSKNNLVHRYPTGSDGFTEPEGAFAICNFWLSQTYALSGELVEAQKWFDAVVSKLPPTGLCAEEIDPNSGEFLGNHPQGFSHIGLINTVMAIEGRESA